MVGRRDDEEAWSSEWDDDEDDVEDTDIDDDEPRVPCPHCGVEIRETAFRCEHCENYISREDAPSDRKPWWVVLGVIVCLYIVYRWSFP